MKNWTRKLLALALALILALTQSLGVVAVTLENENAQIVSSDMNLDASGPNLEGYYSSQEWETAYPQGLFVVEYSTYEIAEGGTDASNPEDVYLGIVVYRLGGTSLGATVSYKVMCVSGDEQMYPASMGTLEFAPQDSTAIAKIRIKNDDKRNGDQLLVFSLMESTTGTLSAADSAVIKIHDDEPYVQSKVSMSVESAVVDKSSGGIAVKLTRTENDTDYCTLVVTTSDGSAKAGADYEAVEQQVVFMPGQTEQTVMIPLVQSENAHLEERSFTVTLSDLKGCVADGSRSLRLNVTNECKEGAQTLTPVDGHEPDLEVDESGSLTDSSQTVINTNDVVDRAQLLQTVIGSANGTAVQSLTSQNVLQSALQPRADSPVGYWGEFVTLTPSDYECGYHTTSGEWKGNKSFKVSDEDLIIYTKKSYNLNLFYSVLPEYDCVDSRILPLYPNTGFGILTAGGKADSKEFFDYLKTGYKDASDDQKKWMLDNEMIYFINEHYESVKYIGNPLEHVLSDFPNTTGVTGRTQKFFIQVYEDKGYDDGYLKVGNTQLRRAVIPFSKLKYQGAENFNVVIGENLNESYIEFEMDGFRWKVQSDNHSNGGVNLVIGSTSTMPDADRYGFYAGTTMKITFVPIVEGGEYMPTPKYLYLEDTNGNVHNAAQLTSDGELAFYIPLETVLSNNLTTLQNSYFMTEEQAKDHNQNLLDKDNVINFSFSGRLRFRVSLVLKPVVILNFKGLPTLKNPMITTDGDLETIEEQMKRVEGVLKNVVTFFGVSGELLKPACTVDLENGKLTYEATDFAFIKVNPEAAGGGIRIKSNLYDLDYQNFGEVKEVPNELCTQIKTDVELTMFNENASYLEPSIVIGDISSSVKTESGFQTVYMTNPLDTYMPFEGLHYITDTTPSLTYYTVRFVISDIYVNGNKGVKEFPVDVMYESTDGLETWKLFSFIFRGGATPQMGEVELTDLHSAYTAVDTSEVEGVDAAGYKPVLKLVDYTTNGYEYILYIPSYYDYQNKDSLLMQTYTQRLKGGDGIGLVLHNYNNGTAGSDAEIISSVSAKNMQYVATYVPPLNLDSEGETGQSHYFEEQRQFYTYNNHVTAFSAMNLNFDTSSLTTALSKLLIMNGNKKAGGLFGLFGGSGPYVQFAHNQITAGLKISLNAGADLSEPSQNPYSDESLDAAAGLFADPTSDLFYHRTAKDDFVDGMGKANAADKGVGTLSFDMKVILTYNTLTHQYELTRFTYTGIGALSFMKNVPIAAAANVLYGAFTFKLAFGISTGGNHVLDHVDPTGKSHYKVTWNGITIAPTIGASIGLGAGLSGVLSAEVGASIDVSAAITFGRHIYVAPQQEFDIDSLADLKDKPYKMTFEGDWTTSVADKFEYEKFSYGYTICDSNSLGDKLTITTVGTSFHLVGITSPYGGEFNITVRDAKGNLLDTRDINTKSTTTELYKLLYWWEAENYTSSDTANVTLIITIENISGRTISLDSFRVYNRAFTEKSKHVPATLDLLSLKIAMYLKFCIIGITINFDPAYMLVKYGAGDAGTSLTLGTIGYSHTWVFEAQKNSADSDRIQMVLATSSTTASKTSPDYFNTGEYSEARTQSLLQGDISNTAKTQVVSHNGSIYAFYTVLDENEDGSASYYRLYYSKDGVEQGLVTNDIFVGDFDVYTDGTGNLAVMMTASDSSVLSVGRKTDGTVVMSTTDGDFTIGGPEGLSDALSRTCVKVTTLTENGFAEPQTLSGTDSDGMQNSYPVAASTADLKRTADSTATVVFFANDIHTEYDADFNMNWESFNEQAASTSQIMGQIMNSLYKGRTQLHYAILTENGYSETREVPMDDLLTQWAVPGFKITSFDAVMADETNVCLVYSIELPYAQKGGYIGTLKEIHYRKGTLQADGSIQFSKTVVVDSVFDYDDPLTDVFTDVSGLSSKYYNKETAEFYESSLLSNVQLENAVLTQNGNRVNANACKPCLFYQTNSGINYVTYEVLEKILAGTAAESDKVGVLYDDAFEEYVIAVSPKGALSLVYSDSSESGDYTDTLYLVDYCHEDRIWNHARRLTYSEVFDQEAYENRQPTGSLSFANFDAFVDGDGNVSISLTSTYAPFSYDYGAIDSDRTAGDDHDLSDEYDQIITDGEGNVVAFVTMPKPDYDSVDARTDVFMITFADRVTDAEVIDFRLSNTIFLEGQQIDAQFRIHNTGDYMISDMMATLYLCNLNNGGQKVLQTKQLTGTFLAGDLIEQKLSFTVGEDPIPDNSLLCIRLTDRSGYVTYYDSYTDCYQVNNDADTANDLTPTYHLINQVTELYFAGTQVTVDSKGMMHYQVNIGNAGLKNAAHGADVYCKLYTHNAETGEYTLSRTLFSFSVDASMLTSDSTAQVVDTYDVSEYLVDGELYYRFEIHTEDAQYDTGNDLQDLSIAYQEAELVIDSIVQAPGGGLSTDGRIVRQMKLGEELVIQGSVISQYFGASDLRAYEVGSSCLSIDDSAEDGSIRVKVIALPENQQGYVKLLLSLKGTVIHRYLYLHISNTDIVDLQETHSEEGWSITGQDHVYAVNYDLLTTGQDGSSLTFDFVGKDLRLFGDLLENGGSFHLTIQDQKGNLVAEDTVSTAAALDDYGMLLYKSENLSYDHYTVRITAQLEQGQTLALDRAQFTIDTSDADTTPYPQVEHLDETLDAPLLSGRARRAVFTLDFNRNIELVEGKSLSDLTLDFAELELVDGVLTPTGNTVTFTASEILDGKTLVLTAELSSKPGAIVKYVLADAQIPEGILVGANGKAVNPAIPNYDTISYTLRESGIMSVVVADDDTMPSGSVHKSVKVKFMSVPELSRLKGTKLLYTTQDPDGTQRNIEFHFAQMTEDPRVAVYRADELTLAEEELQKLFSFREGIILNEKNYVLITAQGDYLENDLTTVISDTSLLDIRYEKLRAADSWLAFVNGGPALYVTFPEAVAAADSAAYVQVQQILDGSETQLKLPLAEVSQDGKTLIFAAAEAQTLPAGQQVTYQLLSDGICCDNSQTITRAADGISINPNLETQPLTFRTDVQILSAVPSFDDSGKLQVTVAFSAEMEEACLTGTSLKVVARITEYTKSCDKELTLTYHTASVVSGQTLAVYTCDETAALGYEVISRQFQPAADLTAEGPLVSVDGASCTTAILNRDILVQQKLQAQSVEFALTENSGKGSNVTMTVTFPEAVSADTLTNVYAQAQIQTGTDTQELYLMLDSVRDNVVTFVTKSPVYLTGGQVITITAPSRFADPYGAITDGSGTAVSEVLPQAEHVLNLTGQGLVTSVSLLMAKAENNTVTLRVSVIYAEQINADSFQGSSIQIYGNLEYMDGQTSAVTQRLTFQEAQDGTAIYEGQLILPAEARVARMTLADSAIETDGGALFDSTGKLILSAQLPETSDLTIRKTEAAVTAVLTLREDDTVETLEDVVVSVTYPEKVTVCDLQNITILVDVSGIGQVTFRANTVYNHNTLVFRAEGVDAAQLPEELQITVADQILNLTGDAAVYSRRTGLAMDLAVPDIVHTFQTGSSEPTPPTDPTAPTTPTDPENPENPSPGTGDILLPVLILMLLLSMVGMVLLGRKQRMR